MHAYVKHYLSSYNLQLEDSVQICYIEQALLLLMLLFQSSSLPFFKIKHAGEYFFPLDLKDIQDRHSE